MRPLYKRCAGLDVHRDGVSACVRIRKGKNEVETIHREFPTFTENLVELGTWLREQKITQVAMESTGVYWMPVWNVLEAARFRLDLMLVNATHVRALPGRKTDQLDCERMAELLQYGLVRGSFVPPREIRDLRDLVRRRVQLGRDANRVKNRIHRILQMANLKLSSVVSNVFGVSGRAMLKHLAAGRTDPDLLISCACSSLKHKTEELGKALRSKYREHHRLLLADLLDDLDRIEGKIEALEQRIRPQMEPYADALKRLDTIPGVSEVTCWTLISEIGADMSRFPDAAHLASWAGLCPGNNESAGKRKTGKTRKGNKYLRRVLCQTAWVIARAKHSHLTDIFYRVARSGGEKKANVAVAHRVLVIAYHILRDGTVFQDEGRFSYDRANPERTKQQLLKRLQMLGWEVEVRPKQQSEATQSPHIPAAEPNDDQLRRRGRPCLCKERNLPCPHQRPAQPLGTAKQHKQTPRGPMPSLFAGHCKCQRWGVPCTHQKLEPSKSQDAEDTST